MSLTLNIVILTSDNQQILRFSRQIDGQTSVDTLEQIISAECDGNIIRMEVGNKTLVKGRSLLSQGVKNASDVRVITDVKDLHVLVQRADRNPNNKAIKIPYTPSTTTEDMEARLAREGLNMTGAYFTHGAEVLAKGQTLANQNVRNGDTVHMATKVHGG